MKSVLLLAVVSLALGASSASAQTTIVAPDRSAVPYQRWVEKAAVPTPTTTITVIEAPCPDPTVEIEGAPACTAPWAATIWFEWWMPKWARRAIFYHELGHNFDEVMPEWVRIRYLELIGRPAGSIWRTGNGSGSPNQLFAESYALCAFRTHVPPGGDVQEQEPVGGPDVHNRVCRLIGQAVA